MNKYEVEDNIDFYEQLKKSMEEDENEDSRESHCLITNLPLVEPYITMKCGHSFNYIPLFKDVASVKANNHMERMRLKINQIRCPYCRSVENHVLPHIREYKCGRKDGVNYLDVAKHSMRDFIIYSECKCDICETTEKTIMSPCADKHYCLKHYNELYSRKRLVSKNILNKSNQSSTTGNFVIQTEPQGCCSILKSGPRKGQMCGAVKKIGNTCGRHAPKQ